MKTLVFLVLGLLPFLARAQQFRVDYYCDFESGDCGLKTHKNTGATFRHQDFAQGNRRTKALVLEDLSRTEPWFSERTRCARVSTPVIFPTTFVGPILFSMDYYLVGGDCIQYLQVAQELDNRTQSLARANIATTWTTLKATLQDFGQPVKLVVEAWLNPNCQEPRSCLCSGHAAIDNLRVTSTGVPGGPETGTPATRSVLPPGYRKPYKKSGPTTPPVPCPSYPPCPTPRPVNPVPCPPLPPPRPCPPVSPPPACPPCPYIPPPPPCTAPVCPPIKPCPPYPVCPSGMPWHPKMMPYKPYGDPSLPVWDPIHSAQQGEREQQQRSDN